MPKNTMYISDIQYIIYLFENKLLSFETKKISVKPVILVVHQLSMFLAVLF